MIAQLMRQDQSFRRLPFWVLMSFVWASAVSGIVAWMAASRGESVGLGALTVFTWFSVALYLVFGEIGTRTNPFNMALPIPARKLWVSHFLAVTLTGFTVLIISAGVTAGTLLLVGKLVEGWELDTGALAVIGLLLFAGLLLSVSIVHAFRPDTQDVPMSLRRAGWSLVAAVVPLGLVAALRPMGAAGVVIVLALAWAAFGYVLRAIPAVLSVPIEKQRRVPSVAAADSGPLSWSDTEKPTGVWFALRVVHGVTTCARKPLAMFVIPPFLMFLGFWVSGIDTRWASNTQRFAYPFMIVYTMMVITTMSMNGIGVIDWLPWSRRRILALLTMPVFLSVVVGYGAGRITNGILDARTDPKELLCFVEDRETGEPRLCIRLSECEVSWSGELPEINTPWGEVHEPWSQRVVRGLPMRVYYPYYAPAGSSPEFAALQISRAAAAIFGADIPPDEIRSRYLDSGVDGAPLSSMPELTLQADYPDMVRRSRGVYFPWLMVVVVGWWSLLTAGYMHWLRGDVSEKKRKTMAIAVIAIPMVLWILDFVFEITGVSEISARNALVTNLSRRVGETYTGTIAVWAVSALLVWAAYRLVEHRFDRAELKPTPIGGKCLAG